MVATNSYIEQDIEEFEKILGESEFNETYQKSMERNPYFHIGSIA